MSREQTVRSLFTVGLLALTPFVQAQPNPAGIEFQVNSYTTGVQRHHAIAVAGNGDFVVTWASDGSRDGSSYAVFARRFSSAGTPLATEFQVNTFFLSYQTLPSIANNAAGFVIVWESQSQDGDAEGIFARRFSSTGTALADEFQINARTVEEQRLPSIAADAEGDFVVTWQSDSPNDDIFARRFSSAGVPQGGDFQVNVYTTSYQRLPKVAASASGDFVVTWQSMGQDGGSYGVFARRFSSAGTALGGEIQVSAHTLGAQRQPSVVTIPGGDFVVAWHAYGQDGGGYGVFARRFSSAGTPLATELQVNGFTVGSQAFSSLAAAANGAFDVSWSSFGQDGDGFGTFTRRFSSTGAPLTTETQANTFTTGFQIVSAVAAGGSNFVVTWLSKNQDGSDYGIFAQRFTTARTFDVDGNGQAEALTDGLLAMRFLFGFTGTTLTGGAIGGGCTRCDAAAIELYLTGLGMTLDVDGNTTKDALTDGILVLRYLFGFRGTVLINGAVGQGCSRCDAPAIEGHLAPLT